MRGESIMELLIILNQVQAGLGGSERGDLPLGGKRIAMGAAEMFDKHLKDNEKISITLYCGDENYMAHKDEVSLKLAAMVKKLNPDGVICGPAFHYKNYAEMCAQTGALIDEKVGIPVVVAMAKQCVEVIEAYKDRVDIVKMPKKGETGLNNALGNILELLRLKIAGKDTTEFIQVNTF